MEKIDVIILAGGLGTRLKDVISDCPKVLAPVNNRPFLDIILEGLSRWNHIEHVVMAVGHMAGKIIEEYGKNRKYPFKINFSIEKKLLGTGGGVKKAISLTTTEQVLVLNGDSFVEVDLYELSKFHKQHRGAMTVAIAEVDDASRFGRVELHMDGRVITFLEKDNKNEPGYINAGVYLFNRILFNDIGASISLSLERDLMPVFLKKCVYGFKTKGKFIDIGTPESYSCANFFFKDAIKG